MKKLWTVHMRIGELYFLSQHRELSEDEKTEMDICLKANMRKCQRLADLYNLSLLASINNDTEEQHRICASIEKELERMK